MLLLKDLIKIQNMQNLILYSYCHCCQIILFEFPFRTHKLTYTYTYWRINKISIFYTVGKKFQFFLIEWKLVRKVSHVVVLLFNTYPAKQFCYVFFCLALTFGMRYIVLFLMKKVFHTSSHFAQSTKQKWSISIVEFPFSHHRRKQVLICCMQICFVFWKFQRILAGCIDANDKVPRINLILDCEYISFGLVLFLLKQKKKTKIELKGKRRWNIQIKCERQCFLCKYFITCGWTFYLFWNIILLLNVKWLSLKKYFEIELSNLLANKHRNYKQVYHCCRGNGVYFTWVASGRLFFKAAAEIFFIFLNDRNRKSEISM